MIHKKSRLNGLNKKKFIGFKDKRLAKQKCVPTPSNIASFFGCTIPYSKNDPHQIQFEKNLVLFIAKKLIPLSFVESPFLRRLLLKQNPHVSFPSMHQLMNEILPRLVEKTKKDFISTKVS